MKEVFSKKDVENGKAMAILSYIGPLALIPYLAEKNINMMQNRINSIVESISFVFILTKLCSFPFLRKRPLYFPWFHLHICFLLQWKPRQDEG